MIRSAVSCLAEKCRMFLGRPADLLGYQLHVVHRGEVVVDEFDGADAFERPIERDSLYAVYCATKPIAAIVVALLANDGVLSMADPISGHLDDDEGVFEGVQIQHLLNHSAGLHGYRAPDYLMLPPELRRMAALNSAPTPNWPIGERSAYSEFVPWFLLCLIVESATGVPFADCVRKRVIEPLGLASDLWVGVLGSDYDDIEERLRVGSDVTFDRPVPMMLEVGRRFVTEPCPASVGGLCSARGLAGFYAAMLDISAGRSAVPIGSDSLAELLKERTIRGFDQVLARPAGFGMGFMVDLAAHDFGSRCSPSSFGHGGFAANAWGFADPAHELAVAYTQTARFDADRAVFAIRKPLVDLIYDELVARRSGDL